ncbi:myosin regulatory light chain 11-like isoform X2 [Macrosteles quadrilineatus]|uniref:myosin regulatory light chain 11-like isoform X2 n=1 Tax=Macrosteles quadrilineatus TaxID=74068 RepID=UPI0023E11F45|nr:myosin regulatory light chain 11-like isoform X2 [Macrosteles quadrilineatus]
MADAAPDKKEKKKKEKPSEGEKKAKKSSLKKEKVQEEPKTNEARPEEKTPTEAQEVKQIELEEPPKPEVNQPAQEQPMQDPTSHDEEPKPKPRRKPSKRSLELEIDDEKLNQLKEAFQIFDFDRDGVIDKEDLRKSLIAMGQEIQDIDEEELDKMMSEACQPLDFDAFIMLLGYRTIELDSEEVLRDALSRWDYDGSGLISEEKWIWHWRMHQSPRAWASTKTSA